MQPCWWPQHILPWEEMKKMGGRKSAELTHINYTEILKQCLAAVSPIMARMLILLVMILEMLIRMGAMIDRRYHV